MLYLFKKNEYAFTVRELLYMAWFTKLNKDLLMRPGPSVGCPERLDIAEQKEAEIPTIPTWTNLLKPDDFIPAHNRFHTVIVRESDVCAYSFNTWLKITVLIHQNVCCIIQSSLVLVYFAAWVGK